MSNQDIILTGDSDELLFYHARNECSQTSFLTPPGFFLQVGHLVFAEEYAVRKHRHILSNRQIPYTAEVLLIISGRLKYDIWDYDYPHIQLACGMAGAGEILILGRVAHSFQSLEPTKVLEVKQGPYLGIEDKQIFD